MISVVISAYNEEENIQDCISSCEDLNSEIIVIDNSSTDKTGMLAKAKGAKVYLQKNDPLKIDLQKNFGFSKATGDWVLSLDADERLTPKLIQEIQRLTSLTNDTVAYYIPRKNFMFKKWIRHSLWWPDYQLRLFKRGKGRFHTASVHEELTVKGKTEHLSEPMIHVSYVGITQYVNRMNNIYTEIEAKKIAGSGKRLRIGDAIKLPVSDFMKTFFLQKGYKDGLHGLILSMLQSFYMFLVFAKVWEAQGFYEKDSKEVLNSLQNEVENLSPQIKYWLLTSFIHETRNPIKKTVLHVTKKTLNL